MESGNKFFVACGKGISPILMQELEEIVPVRLSEQRAGVWVAGGLAEAYRVIMWSRTATRVLWPIARFSAASEQELYDNVSAIKWEDHLDASRTIAVSCNVSSSAITHSHYAALRVKDAVVDRFRQREGSRPSIELLQPDVRINVFLLRNQATVNIDLSGESLHKRGYRVDSVKAPLKENLAAAILFRAGWHRIAEESACLVDPLCGSGTLLIEGALMAKDVAPGVMRGYFGFLGWKGHQNNLWQDIKQEAMDRKEAKKNTVCNIFGTDNDRLAIRAAVANCKKAGVFDCVTLTHADLTQCILPSQNRCENGLLITNPPYGERLGEVDELKDLYGKLGTLCKEHYPGFHAAVLTGNPPLAQNIAIRATGSHSVFNGDIACKLLRFVVDPRHYFIPGKAYVRPASALDTNGEMLVNRIRKNQQKLGKWLRKSKVTAYRVYDADMPEFAVSIDVYQDTDLTIHIREYAPPKSVNENRAKARLAQAIAAVCAVFGVTPEQVAVKQRGYAKKPDGSIAFSQVCEGPGKFLVNYRDFWETGLILQLRATRQLVGDLAGGGHFLNLFGNTGTHSVYAACARALSTTTIEGSGLYSRWAKDNLAQNGFGAPDHQVVCTDSRVWLDAQTKKKKRTFHYDLIWMAPPTFFDSSPSYKPQDVWEEHRQLILDAAGLLSDSGTLLYFSNYKKFRMHASDLPGWFVRDISARTQPLDFSRKKQPHGCWQINKLR